jgi:precorrin-2 methylase
MTVYFIGAGPGAPDLITVRGLKLIERCPVCLYAGLAGARGDRARRACGGAGQGHGADASR